MAKYQQVEYIESTGTQWIDLNYTIDSSNIQSVRYILDARPTNTAVGNRWWANGIGGGSRNSYHVSIGNGSSSSYPFTYGDGYYDRGTDEYGIYGTIGTRYIWDYKANSRYRVYNASGGIVVDIVPYFNTPTVAGKLNLCCWRRYNGNVGYCFSEQIFMCRIFLGNTPVRDMVPCYRTSDSVIGMFDNVENKFYTNAGSGTFLKGPNITTNIGFKKNGIMETASILEVGSQVSINPLNYINTNEIKEI